MRIAILSLIALTLPFLSVAKPSAEGDVVVNKDFRGPRSGVILVIRHAEKPAQGPDLSAEGQERAKAYPAYFKTLTIGDKPVAFDSIYASADSKNSQRPRLTVEPLSRSLNLRIHNKFKDKDFEQLAAEISLKQNDKCVLVCWHHGEIPGLLGALGADPDVLLPKSKWPADEFGWALQLRYDEKGRLIPGECRRFQENIPLSRR
jgi:hypothetical protein